MKVGKNMELELGNHHSRDIFIGSSGTLPVAALLLRVILHHPQALLP